MMSNLVSAAYIVTIGVRHSDVCMCARKGNKIMSFGKVDALLFMSREESMRIVVRSR